MESYKIIVADEKTKNKCVNFLAICEEHQIDQTIVCKFSISTEYKPQAGDFIGIYPIGWSDLTSDVWCKKMIQPENISFFSTQTMTKTTTTTTTTKKIHSSLFSINPNTNNTLATIELNITGLILPATQKYFQFVYVRDGRQVNGVSSPFEIVCQEQEMMMMMMPLMKKKCVKIVPTVKTSSAKTFFDFEKKQPETEEYFLGGVESELKKIERAIESMKLSGLNKVEEEEEKKKSFDFVSFPSQIPFNQIDSLFYDMQHEFSKTGIEQQTTKKSVALLKDSIQKLEKFCFDMLEFDHLNLHLEQLYLIEQLRMYKKYVKTILFRIDEIREIKLRASTSSSFYFVDQQKEEEEEKRIDEELKEKCAHFLTCLIEIKKCESELNKIHLLKKQEMFEKAKRSFSFEFEQLVKLANTTFSTEEIEKKLKQHLCAILINKSEHQQKVGLFQKEVHFEMIKRVKTIDTQIKNAAYFFDSKWSQIEAALKIEFPHFTVSFCSSPADNHFFSCFQHEQIVEKMNKHLARLFIACQKVQHNLFGYFVGEHLEQLVEPLYELQAEIVHKKLATLKQQQYAHLCATLDKLFKHESSFSTSSSSWSFLAEPIFFNISQKVKLIKYILEKQSIELKEFKCKRAAELSHISIKHKNQPHKPLENKNMLIQLISCEQKMIEKFYELIEKCEEQQQQKTTPFNKLPFKFASEFDSKLDEFVLYFLLSNYIKLGHKLFFYLPEHVQHKMHSLLKCFREICADDRHFDTMIEFGAFRCEILDKLNELHMIVTAGVKSTLDFGEQCMCDEKRETLRRVLIEMEYLKGKFEEAIEKIEKRGDFLGESKKVEKLVKLLLNGGKFFNGQKFFF